MSSAFIRIVDSEKHWGEFDLFNPERPQQIRSRDANSWICFTSALNIASNIFMLWITIPSARRISKVDIDNDTSERMSSLFYAVSIFGILQIYILIRLIMKLSRSELRSKQPQMFLYIFVSIIMFGIFSRIYYDQSKFQLDEILPRLWYIPLSYWLNCGITLLQMGLSCFVCYKNN